VCSKEGIRRYRARLSGPLLDRFDMHLWVGAAPYAELQAAPEGECSAAIRARVSAARIRQRARFVGRRATHTNAQMTPRLVRNLCPLDAGSQDLLALHSARTGTSTRGIERIVRVARTIADLRGAEDIAESDVVEAIGYRYLDEPPVVELEGNYGGASPARDLAS
jgi:magnesium chelatase family protein